jgi:hypothetical protein
MGPSKLFASTALLTCLLAGCMHHDAQVRSASLPAPSPSPVQHTGRLWVELGDATWEHQCRMPQGQRELCFSGVRRAAFGALRRSLWNSFPEVALREGDTIPTGDYLLKLDVTIDASAPDRVERAGWSALATGAFELSRDGRVLRAEKLGSRSRAEFGYGSALGIAAGEVVDAFALHVAEVLGTIPEDRPLQPLPLPAVMAEVLAPAPASAPAAPPAITVDTAPSSVPVEPATARSSVSVEPATAPSEPPPAEPAALPAEAPAPTPVAAQ